MHRRTMVLLPLLLAAGPASRDAATSLAGRYYEQFPDGTIDGDKYTGENIVEIVPVAPRAAYFRIELDFFNGHHCSVFGVAQANADALTYRAAKPNYEGSTCELKMKRSGKSLLIDDNDGACRPEHCGARGGLSRITLPYASKRPIRYLARLRGSDQYRDALAEWREEKQ